jgi:regulatory protein
VSTRSDPVTGQETTGQASGSASGPTDAWTGGVATGVRAWVGHAAEDALPPDPVAQGPDADPESVARKILLDQLTGRARTRKELSDKLTAKQVPEEIAVRLLDRFTEVGLIDDAAFARLWVDQRSSAHGKGLARRALAQELRRKGVDDETARTVLEEIDPSSEEEAARVLVRRKLRSLARFDDTTATRRLVGMLARKGYSSGLAFSVVRDELAAAGRESPDGD